MIDTNSISEKIYNVLKGFGLKVTRLDVDGNVTLNSASARRFTVSQPNIIVRFSPNDKTISLMTGPGDVEEKIRKMLQSTARECLYNYDYRRFAKKISPRGEKSDIEQAKESDDEVMESVDVRSLSAEWLEHIRQTRSPEDYARAKKVVQQQQDRLSGVDDQPQNQDLQVLNRHGKYQTVKTGKTRPQENNMKNTAKPGAEVMEGMGHMYGSSKTSYQPVGENVKLVVRHRQGVNEEQRGSRSRNIKEIYIQRGDERFRLPENNLNAARAMARHVQQGGEVFDSIGESIMNMATEYRKLREFVRYVNGRGLVNESNSEYVELAQQSISEIRENFRKLTGVRTYATAVENIQSRNSVEMLDEDDDIQSAFTETHFDDRVQEAMDSIKLARSRHRAYENAVTEAIAAESFAGFRDMMLETELQEPLDETQKLAHRVQGLSMCTESRHLRSFLNTVSSKIAEGVRLSEFERQRVAECLTKLRESQAPCPACSGRGHKPAAGGMDRDCPACDGTGKKQKVSERSDPLSKFETFVNSCDIF